MNNAGGVLDPIIFATISHFTETLTIYEELSCIYGSPILSSLLLF